jgi:beta-lactam-binding protein with PASTA domain
MKIKEFFGKFVNAYLWGNLLAMALVVAVLCFGVKYGLEIYTHHGEGIKVPQLVNMTTHNARVLLLENGLELVVNDSGYNKRLPADCILAQSPGAGMMVKSGHVIYVTVNSPSSPSFAIPDLIDNSSYREAEAKLTAMGFRLLPPKYVVGEKDWVYGIVSRGRRISTGDVVSVGSPLTLLVGNGHYGDDEEIDYVSEPAYTDEQPLDLELGGGDMSSYGTDDD